MSRIALAAILLVLLVLLASLSLIAGFGAGLSRWLDGFL